MIIKYKLIGRYDAYANNHRICYLYEFFLNLMVSYVMKMDDSLIYVYVNMMTSYLHSY
jgi:hypothetical protein